MPVFLGQLVYTSFPQVGFKLLASTQVPVEIQQAFVEQVVYQYWNTYNPPKYGYRAAYLHQVTPKHNLFGWLYNDGLDDLGRNHVPYFICYYLAERLHALHLENILTCLQKGPLALMDRHSPPGTLGTIVPPDLSSYQPARIGVAIPADVRERSHVALKQRRLLNLFISVGELEVATPMLRSRPSAQNTISFVWGKRSPFGGSASLSRSAGSALSPFGGSANAPGNAKSLTLSPTLLNQATKTSVPALSSKPVLLVCLVIGIGSMALLMSRIYNPLLPPAPSSQAQQYPFPLKNTSLGNVLLAKTLSDHSDSVWSTTVSSDGQTLVSSSADKTIKVWNLSSGQLIRTLSGHTDTVRAVTLSADGKILASSSGDKTIKLWNLQTGKELRTLSGHSGPVWSIAISRDGYLVSSSENGSIKIWNLQTGKLLRTLTGHSGRVFSVAISPNGQITSGGIDKTIKIWNLRTGRLVRTLAGHTDSVRAVTISPNGQKLASGSWDKTVKVWNLQTGELLHTFTGHTERVVSVAFSSDEQIVSAGTDKTIKIWSLATGKLVRNLSGHSDWVLSVAISPSGQTMASSSKDKTIKIWR